MADPEFTGNMSKISSDWDSLTEDEKVALYKSTDYTKQADIEDLRKISPFYGHLYYEE